MDISLSEQITNASAELNEIYSELESVDTYILEHEADQLLMKSFHPLADEWLHLVVSLRHHLDMF